MFALDVEDMYIPNTKAMRDLLESLNYSIKPISTRVNRDISTYKSICFREWVGMFKQIKQTNTMYYCTDKPNLTEDQSIFVMNILHVCDDYQTFEEAVEQYINSNY